MTDQPTLFATTAATIPATPKTPTTSHDTWLTQHLIAAGYLTETGLTRRARLRPCPRCTQLILAGLDDDWAALEARADPHPLNPLGEALTHLAGHHTYALHQDSRGYHLDRRTADHITHQPAGTRLREDILRAHHCNTDPPTPPLTTTSNHPSATPPQPPNTPPPF